VRADLHIHTALSVCASEEMTPRAIAEEAVRKGLSMIAICDHNSAGNTEAVRRAADLGAAAAPSGERLEVIAGMEITTTEEVHVLGLFPSQGAALAAADEVLEALPPSRPPREDRAGEVFGGILFDGEGNVTGREERLLFMASSHTLAAAVALIKRHGGIAVASHVDRRSFSVPGQLGVFPEDVVFDALEVSAPGVRAGRHLLFSSLGLPLVSSSDSHYLDDIGTGYTLLDVEKPSFDELVMALRGEGGRRCSLA
jgi:hypothetical protein